MGSEECEPKRQGERGESEAWKEPVGFRSKRRSRNVGEHMMVYGAAHRGAAALSSPPSFTLLLQTALPLRVPGAASSQETSSEPLTTEETMEVPHWNQGPMHEAKPRKVRFKLASSYSGRVLKHVYEDGQELESPGETYPHSFIHAELPRHLHAEQLCGFEEVQELLAKRINIYRGTGGYAPLCYDDLQDGDDKVSLGNAVEPVLDFGKIIIYTNNLKIIRGPQKKAETSRSHHRARGEGGESSPGPDLPAIVGISRRHRQAFLVLHKAH
ncbi:hypothetical protein P4O66_002844 [Electrophorus voltai]|uniref:Glutaredoxin domain-containing cysteine-rich protein 2 n=1 Tax=Electrophorus voltai TaxID=2609070 RepID=A0AAD8YUC8_9TELE|nr:hypothetical protein P4O66_002844 [Electrophorus voltai]